MISIDNIFLNDIAEQNLLDINMNTLFNESVDDIINKESSEKVHLFENNSENESESQNISSLEFNDPDHYEDFLDDGNLIDSIM